MTTTTVGFPLAPSELTPEWLTGALQRNGLIGDARVVAIEHEIIGEGVGFVGQLARVHLHYDRKVADAPPTLVGKFPSPNEGARQTAALFGVYAREVGFYRDLNDDAGIGTPRCYFAAITDDAGGFLLLLEDLHEGRFGDQVAGCTVAEAHMVLGELARMHAHWWNRPRLKEAAWAQGGVDVVRGAVTAAYAAIWPVFLERFRDELTPSVLAHGETAGATIMRLMEQYEQVTTFTFTHSDLRVDNLFFPASGDRRLVVVDWQGALIAWSGAYDVAYFLGTGLDPQELHTHREALVRGYHDALVAAGVNDYPYEQLTEEYRAGLLMAFAVIGVIAGGMLDIVNARAVELFKSFFGRLQAAMDEAKVWEL